jgi:hypothetical protein
MKVIIWILLFGLYLTIGRVIVKGLNKAGYIDDWTLDFLIFVPYLLLPLTLFIIGVQVASEKLIKFFKF